MKESGGHVRIQNLIDISAKQKLSLVSRIRVLTHVAMCPQCSEYKNRNLLFSTLLFGTNKNHERVNSYQDSILHKSKSVQSRLASFPEQNPSPILEIEKSGNVSYQNPAFTHCFPGVSALTLQNEFLARLQVKFQDLINGQLNEVSNEVVYKGVHYIERARYLQELQVVRVFYLDITEQKKFEQIIRQKNKEITDSIHYSKRIQEAILPSIESIKAIFPFSFILYKPKDIVAGDFYWLCEADDFIFIAAADCTGHGVPGALVSVVCSNALNRSVKEYGIRDTGRILDKTRALVLETLASEEKNVKDGMDISILSINRKTKEMSWSGANNPIWYFSQGAMHEIKADKQPVGLCDNPQPFTTYKLSIGKGDHVFLFSDGYADQFGGPKEKKFKYKQFNDLLTLHIQKSKEEVLSILDSAFLSWKGPLEQTDDVLVMGIEI